MNKKSEARWDFDDLAGVDRANYFTCVASMDPGSVRSGLTVVSARPHGRFSVDAYWDIKLGTGSLQTRLERLEGVLQGPLRTAIERYGAEVFAIEEPPSAARSQNTMEKFTLHASWVLGVASGIAMHAWWSACRELDAAGRSADFVEVGMWRKALGTAYRCDFGTPREERKREACRLVKMISGAEVGDDVAEAALLGWACLLRPALVAGKGSTSRMA